MSTFGWSATLFDRSYRSDGDYNGIGTQVGFGPCKSLRFQGLNVRDETSCLETD